MSPNPLPVAEALPHALPEGPGARLLLLAIRRIGAHGLNDAVAANMFLSAFGSGFRRPLVLARSFMADLAAAANATIAIAPCCCARMTGPERALLEAVGDAERRPERTRLLLIDVLAERRADGIVATAAALSAAFADAGMPVRTMR